MRGDNEIPKRRFELTIRISGDTWGYTVHEVLRIAAHVAAHGPECSLCSGGCSTGAYVQITESPDQTHDGFVKELAEWCAAQRAKKPEAV